ncbi:MAG: hypothetical protein S4CHLAM7_00790 [Chlamydiae bacterium]|nr:hypothetical protein [Chlamydiota bacterium]
MFLKEFLNNLIYPKYCKSCHASLKDLKLLCEPCQRILVLRFDFAKECLDDSFSRVVFLFQSDNVSKTLFNLYQNPFNLYLSKALASFYIFKLYKENGFWPHYILTMKNRMSVTYSLTLEIQKQVSKLLKIPLLSFTKLNNQKLPPKRILILALSKGEWVNFRSKIVKLEKHKFHKFLTIIGKDSL